MSAPTGEMITLAMPDGTAEAYVARPDSAPDGSVRRGVLFFIDAIGLRPQTRAMADRIASWGYVVLVPNVFYRSGTAAQTSPSEPLSDADARAAFMAEAMPRVRDLTPDLATGDIEAYLDALHALPRVASGPVAVTGYCMGGRLALLAAATRPDDVAAVGMFHTGRLVTDDPDSPHLHLDTVTAEILAIHADHDRSMDPEAIAKLEHALTSVGVTHHTSVYPGAPHGYTMADTPMYNHDAAEYHFVELERLLERTLG
ncbi:dienelactone hydrolase family protein [Gordonia sp. NPDC003950]